MRLVCSERVERWIPGTRPGMTENADWSRATNSGVIAGLVPAIQPSTCSFDRWRSHTGQRGKEIVPMQVLLLDQIDLPGARPFLHRLLPLDRLAHAGEFLEPDKTMDLVLAGEARNFAGAVLLDTPNDPVSHTDVEGASRLAGENVDPEAAHGMPQIQCAEYAAPWIAGTSPAMTCAARETVQ